MPVSGTGPFVNLSREQFASFGLLNERVTEIEHRENQCLWKCDCRTVEKAKTKGVKRHINVDLVYYSVHYIRIYQ